MNCSANNQVKVKSNQNIQVYVRVRPLNSRERGIRSCEVVEVQSPKEIVVKQLFESKTTKKFTFDRSFGPDSRQSEVYQSVVAPLIEEVLAGYNCTVFAYGQTGTGKTHTMVGIENPDLKSSWEDESMVGIIPRALSHLFDELRMMEVEFSMRISYLELYNEELCDLLSSDDSTKIRIFDDSTKKGSVIIQGLEEIPVHSKDDVYKLLEKGKDRRRTATTLMNAQSSRSHTVFSILVHIKENNMDGEEMLKIGKLNLVDLAGSENISKAGNEKGIRTRETVNINQSLLTLGRVITALVERTPHIPYRESKLTRLLQESLGGRTKTSIIATISPGHKDLEETLSTLEYAHRAKNIQNRPEINQKLTKKTVLKEYTEEIDRLKRDLMATRDKNGIYLAEDTFNDMQYKLDSQNKELNEKVLLVKALKEELVNKERIFNEVSLHLIEKSEELKKTENVLSQTRGKLDDTKKVLAKTGRRMEEKTHLVQRHVVTEQVLTEQATKLIEVADIAASDTHQLHNTIERRRNVEVKNKSACESFVSQMQSLQDSMKEQLATLNKEHKSYSQIIEEEIGKYSCEYKKFSSTATAKLKLISEQCIESLSGVEQCRGKYIKQFADANANHVTALDDELNGLETRENTFKSILEDRLTEILEVVTQQNLMVLESYGKIIEQVTNHNQYIGQNVTGVAERLEEFAANTTASVIKEISAINNQIETRKRRASKQQQAVENFIKQLQTYDEEERQSIEQFEKVPIRLADLNVNIENQIKSESRIVKKLGEDSAKSCADICDIDSHAKVEMDNLRTKYTNLNVVVKQTLEENLNKVKESLTVMENRIKEQGTESVEILERMRGDCATIETSLQQQTSSECDQAAELIGKEAQRVMQCQAQYRAFNKSLQTSVNEFSSNSNATMTECASNLIKFKENEFKTYTPTGQTPCKKEFTYPRVLAATSPHSNIIRRFRLEKGWLDADTTSSTINEQDSEICFDSSCDELGINSTPISLIVETPNTMLKDIKSELNCQNQQLSIIGDKLQRTSVPTVSQYDQENKENCID